MQRLQKENKITPPPALYGAQVLARVEQQTQLSSTSASSRRRSRHSCPCWRCCWHRWSWEGGRVQDVLGHKLSRPRIRWGLPPCKAPRCVDSTRCLIAVSAFLSLTLYFWLSMCIPALGCSLKLPSVTEPLSRYCAGHPPSLGPTALLARPDQTHSRNCVIPTQRMYQQA